MIAPGLDAAHVGTPRPRRAELIAADAHGRCRSTQVRRRARTRGLDRADRAGRAGRRRRRRAWRGRGPVHACSAQVADRRRETEFDAAPRPGAGPLAKGLEFDHVVLVEPAAIVAGEPDRVTGLRRLYVCLTRAVTSLVVVHAEPLPAELGEPPA